jgi:hypothetical protein
MPYDEAAWKRRSLAHYLALAQIDVPRAAETALALAGTAESVSAGGLAGLHAELQKRLREMNLIAPERAPTTNRRT